MQLINLPFL